MRKVRLNYSSSQFRPFPLELNVCFLDFKANDETIDYFLKALKLKREKYSQMNMKGRADAPLSLPMSEFVLYYWPGVLSCCSRIFKKCSDFETHINSAHGSRGKALKPTVAAGYIPPSVNEDEDLTEVPPASPVRQEAATSRTTRRSHNSTANQTTRTTSREPTSSIVTPPPPTRRSDRLSAESIYLVFNFIMTGPMEFIILSFHSRDRVCRGRV